MRTVREVMRGDIEVLRTTETVADAASFLAAHREDSVPLCLGDGSLAGTVSNRDIVTRVVAKGRDPREVSAGRVRRARRRAGARRRRLGRRSGVHHVPAPRRDRLPVIEDDRVVGFVTQRDARSCLPPPGGLPWDRADRRRATAAPSPCPRPRDGRRARHRRW